jgi:hypothetical protein
MVEFFGDGSGGTKSLDAAYVNGSSIAINEASSLSLLYTVASTDATSIEIQPQYSFDNVTWWPLNTLDQIVAGSVKHSDLVYDAINVDGNHSAPKLVELPSLVGYIRIRAKRTGGSGATELLVTGLFG